MSDANHRIFNYYSKYFHNFVYKKIKSDSLTNFKIHIIDFIRFYKVDVLIDVKRIMILTVIIVEIFDNMSNVFTCIIHYRVIC